MASSGEYDKVASPKRPPSSLLRLVLASQLIFRNHYGPQPTLDAPDQRWR